MICPHQAAAQDLFACQLITEQLGDDLQFILVELKNIGSSKAFLDDGFVEESVAKIYIKNLQAVFGTAVKEHPDGPSGFPAPLRERSITDGLRMRGNHPEGFIVWNVAPGGLGVNRVNGVVGIANVGLYDTGMVRCARQMIHHIVGLKLRNDIFPILVHPDCTDDNPFMTKLGGMEDAVRWGAAKFAPVLHRTAVLIQCIPQDFSDSYYEFVIVHAFK